MPDELGFFSVLHVPSFFSRLEEAPEIVAQQPGCEFLSEPLL